jgi:subtilisin family serine protease
MIARAGKALLLALALCLAGTQLAAATDREVRATVPAEVRQQILVLLRLPPEHFRPNADYGGSYGDGLGRSARRRMADRIAHSHGLTLVSDWAMPAVGLDCYVMSAPGGQSPAAVAAELSKDAGVVWSQPMNVFHAQAEAATPNDPLFRAQPAAVEWRLADLHQIATGRNVHVAVIDSKIEAHHPDLIGQVQVEQNFVDDRTDVAAEAHGTGVAGIIAARADNGVGIVGIAPQARLLALRACWQQTPASGGGATLCDSLSLAKALHFAITHDTQVINLSLSGPFDPLLGKLIDVALRRGITVVGAYDRNLPAGGFPASQPGVVAVVEESVTPPPAGVFSAPGRDVPTTQPGGRWYLVSGSSYAAAHVSGLFALVRERAPQAHVASDLAAAWPSGAIDPCATLLRTSRSSCDCACAYAGGYPAVSRR